MSTLQEVRRCSHFLVTGHFVYLILVDGTRGRVLQSGFLDVPPKCSLQVQPFLNKRGRNTAKVEFGHCWLKAGAKHEIR